MPGGAFIDDGDGHEWADALRFAPWIDLEHDGTLFANIAFLTPDRAFECPFNPIQDQPNTGPASFRHPTLASGCEAQPPEGTSGCGTTGRIHRLRMAGNGENCSEAGCGQPAGTVCTMPLCPGKRPAVSAPFHSPTSSDEGQPDNV